MWKNARSWPFWNFFQNWFILYTFSIILCSFVSFEKDHTVYKGTNRCLTYVTRLIDDLCYIDATIELLRHAQTSPSRPPTLPLSKHDQWLTEIRMDTSFYRYPRTHLNVRGTDCLIFSMVHGGDHCRTGVDLVTSWYSTIGSIKHMAS